MKPFFRWIRKNMVLLFSVMLVVKLLIFRFKVLDDLSLLGILSDIGAIGLLMALPACFVAGKWRKGLQTAMAVLISTIWFATAIYYSYYGNVPTYYTLSSLNQVGQISESITASLELYMWLFFVDFFMVLLISPFSRERKPWMKLLVRSSAKPSFWHSRKFSLIITAASLAVVVGSLLGSKHIENSHALAKRLGVLSYQLAVNSATASGQQQELTAAELESLREEVRAWFAGQEEQERSLYHGIASDHNLIVVQIESMQNFVIGLELNGQEVTPYLNQLSQQSFYFPNVYQQIAEGNTSDAEFLMNTGAYPSAVQATSKQLTGREAASLPRLLAKQGYESYTFHVNDVTFWNRNEMYPALGFTGYYDKASFENDQFNSFGASDEQLYKVALDKLEALQSSDQRFYAQLVTVSSHHPFKIPEQYQELELPAELEDTQLGHYLQAMHYTDKQLGQFMEQLEEKGLLQQSVVAIYGDHFGLQTKDNDPEWVSEQLGISYHDIISRMNVPFIVKVPGVAGERVEQVGGQIDMLPTLLNVLGISEPNSELILFGSDLLNAMTNIVGVRYYLPTGSFFNDEVLFVPGTGFSDGTAISLETHQPIEFDDTLRQDYSYILELMGMSDLYTSNYPQRK